MGVLVRPGDIVGCDRNGCIVALVEVAENVLVIAARIAVDIQKSRRRLFERLGRPPDETVEFEAAAELLDNPEVRNGLTDQRKFSTSIRSLPMSSSCV